ncbi:MAG: DUF2378 family protein [Polyangiales bacterium]
MFVEPDWSQSVDFAARLAAIPAHAVVRGMFLQLLIDSMGREYKEKLEPRRYVAFKNYPMREYVELLARATQVVRTESAAMCVRRLGRGVYPAYEHTITGTAIFAMAGRDFGRVIEAAPTAYKVGLAPAIIRVRRLEARHAEVELREVYNLPDLHQVGIWEGAMAVCGVSGQIKTHVVDYGAVDFDVTWR